MKWQDRHTLSRSVNRRQSIIDVVFAMMFLCDTMTPQGVPVEPDVNIKAARSCGSMCGKPLAIRCASPKLFRVPSVSALLEWTSRSVRTLKPTRPWACLARCRVSTNAKRGVVVVRMARTSSAGATGDTGTAIRPALRIPKYETTQKKELSARRTARSPLSPPHSCS